MAESAADPTASENAGKEREELLAASVSSSLAEHFREQGNAAMANHDYKAALVAYQRGIDTLTTHGKETNAEELLLVALYSNLALTFLRSQEYEQSIQASSVVIETYKQQNAKIYYRRACAREGRGIEILQDSSRIGGDCVAKSQQLLQHALEDLRQAQEILRKTTGAGANTKIGNNRAHMMVQETRRAMERIHVRLHDLEELENSFESEPDSSSLRPSPPDQRRIVQQLLEKQLSLQQPGEAFFLLEWNWYQQWCQYTKSHKMMADLLPKWKDGADAPSEKQIEGSATSTTGPPGPIDNSQLLLVDSNDNAPTLHLLFYKQWYKQFADVADQDIGDGDDKVSQPASESTINNETTSPRLTIRSSILRPNLVRGYHYEVMPREIYAALREWYGEVTSSICRRSTCDRKEPQLIRVPMYPLLKDFTSNNARTLKSTATVVCCACQVQLQGSRRCGKCLAVAYCNRQCQASHWEFHKLECRPINNREEEEKKNDKDHLILASSTRLEQNHHVGLKNIGNTCFMNSVLQCLVQTTPLTRHFLSNAYQEDLNQDNPLGTGGDLADAYGRVVKEMRMRSQPIRGTVVVTPLALKRSVARFAPRFAGQQQHDAQEFLAYLMDGLHEDLNRIQKAPYVELPTVTEKDNMEIAGARAWDTHRKRNNSLVQDCFYGQFKSTCVCPKCEQVSVSFDAFNHVSLELPQENNVRLSMYSLLFFPAPQDGQSCDQPTRFGFELYPTQPIAELKQSLAELVDVQASRIVLCVVANHAIQEMLDEKQPVGNIRTSSFIAAYEMDPFDSDCFHVVTGHVKKTESGLDTFERYMDNFGFPFMASFPTSFSCRQTVEFLYNRLMYMMADDDRERCQFRVHAGGIAGAPLKVFPLSSQAENEDNESLTDIIPIDSDAELIEYLGKDSVQQFVHIWIEWTFEKQNDDAEHSDNDFGPLVNCRFLAFETHSSFVDVAKRQNSTSASNKSGLTLDECFESFQRPERLDEHNMWYCSNCKEHVRALKTMQLWKLPNILVVHFKRFEYKHMFRRDKLDTLVSFPLEGLAMDKHCAPVRQSSLIDGSIPADYDLFGVVNHFGRMGFGHYTAFTRHFDEHELGDWALCDDSTVHTVDVAESIVTQAAYVLFYRRRVFG